MMKNRVFILTILWFSLTSILFSQEWTLTFNAQDANELGSSDDIYMGTCDDCHDGFHFGEDEYHLTNTGNSYTDINILNFAWIGSQDENGNVCSEPTFFVDKRQTHGPEDLLEWNVSGFTSGFGNDIQIQLSWEIDYLYDDIDIYLYIGNIGYDMKTQSSLTVNSSDLATIFDGTTPHPLTNVNILAGGCASTGTTAFYIDNDSDGIGTGEASYHCAGFEPENYVAIDGDVDDSIYCESNVIDLCNVCDGNNECVDCNGDAFGNAFLDDCNICSDGNSDHEANIDIDCNGDCFGTAFLDDCNICSNGNSGHEENSDKDCNGTCFGNAIIDDCEICDGLNQSCLNDIFLDGPVDLNAHIQESLISFTWDQPNYPDDHRIVGFHIYTQDEGLIYIADTSEENFEITQYQNGTFCVSAFDQFDNESAINCTVATEMTSYTFTLHDGANLISFPTLPTDVSLDNIFEPIESIITGIITEGKSAAKIGDWWVGSLTEIESIRGYWVIIELEDVFGTENFEITGYPIDRNIQYEIFEGQNLISYIGNDAVPLTIAIPDEFEDDVSDIISEGNAANNHPVIGWIGSLIEFNIGQGYWLKVNHDMDFYWEQEAFTFNSIGRQNEISIPISFSQSMEQSFYFIKETIHFSPQLNEDVILSYCNDELTGYRLWNGTYTDIPVMGNDGNLYSQNYCTIDDSPYFIWYDASEDVYKQLGSTTTIPQWKSNGIQFIQLTLTENDIVELPQKSSITSAYPNPFNPVCHFEYELNVEGNITASIFDIYGQEIELLANEYKDAGLHNIGWNGENYASGTYIFVLTTESKILTKKVVLLK